MKNVIILFLFIISGLIYAGNVTVTLIGVDPLTINIKGNTQNEQAGALSVYLYYRDDATTTLTIENVIAAQLETAWGWGTGFRTMSIEEGSWSKGGHTFTRRLFYDNVDLNGQDDNWTLAGINAIVCDFTSVGTGHAYVEINGDGLPNWAGVAHIVSYSNRDAALPVELSSFTSAISSNNIELKWSTATEVNNYGFAVERNGEAERGRIGEWVSVGFIKGSGNSNSLKQYSFMDKNLSAGKYLYRLKQLDNDGSFSYSDVIEAEIITIPTEMFLGQNYPNPFNPTTNIKYGLSEEAIVQIDLYNCLGQKVRTLVNENQTAGVQTLNINASDLSSGYYILNMRTSSSKNTFNKAIKMCLVK